MHSKEVNQVPGQYRNSSVTISASVSVRMKMGQRTHRKPSVCHLPWIPLHFHTPEMSSSQSLLLDGRHGHSPCPHSFISQPTSQLLSGDLYTTTRTDFSRHVRGVCDPPKGSVQYGLSVDPHACRKPRSHPFFFFTVLEPCPYGIGEHRLWLCSRMRRYDLSADKSVCYTVFPTSQQSIFSRVFWLCYSVQG